MMNYGIVVHGGAGAPKELADGCRKACEKGFAVLEKGGSALDATMEAVRVMEDDGRFNAGGGSESPLTPLYPRVNTLRGRRRGGTSPPFVKGRLGEIWEGCHRYLKSLIIHNP